MKVADAAIQRSCRRSSPSAWRNRRTRDTAPARMAPATQKAAVLIRMMEAVLKCVSPV